MWAFFPIHPQLFSLSTHCFLIFCAQESKFTLRGQTVHWIGAQFCVCMFLDSRDKSLNMRKFRRNKESKEQKKNKGSILVAESAYNAQNAQLGLVMYHFKIVTPKKQFRLSRVDQKC